MPVRPTYPGVYVEEVPSGLRPIAGVATARAAFLGAFPRGLLNRAVELRSLADFERAYGGLSAPHETSYAIQQFFLNGGSDAVVVRVATTGDAVAANNAVSATHILRSQPGAGDQLFRLFAGQQIRGVSAENPGAWGNALRAEVDYNTRPPAPGDAGPLFNLTLSLTRAEGDRTVNIASERYSNLTVAAGPGHIADVVNAGSVLVQVDRTGLPVLPVGATRPAASGTLSNVFPAGTAFAAGVRNLTLTLRIGGVDRPAIAIALNHPALDMTGMANALQTAIRAAAANLAALGEQPYLAEASVSVIGANTAANPAMLAIRLGTGARPFAPDAELRFGGADSGFLNLTFAGGPVANRATTAPQQFVLAGGQDGIAPGVIHYRGARATKTGLYALEDVDLFNILCIPDAAGFANQADMRALYTEAQVYCAERRSMVLVDIPAATVRLDQMQAWLSDNAGLRHPNAAVYYPRTRVPDPLNGGRLRSIGPSGTIAGLYARTDTARGVWKAPAGTEARLRNVQALDYLMTDLENGALNPLGVNCLRTLPIYSTICWGARTLEGADQLASDWKYVPVRRLTLFLEESLYRGTQWVVFEPNDEPLWAQIRLNVGAFMADLFRKGAFQGSSPRDAFFVRCDGTTTTQTDIDNGIVNIEVGFAPLKPAEFVILKIQQIARQAAV
jgi:hypothetical protein